MRTLRAWWSRITGFLRPGTGEREFAEELDSVLDLNIADNIRSGMTPGEARRQALARMGSVAATREAHRDRRGLPGIDALLFDVKLGGRMLIKYPWLTVIGGLAMAFGIAVGIVTFQVLSLIINPSVPLPQGDRLVQIRNWDVEANKADPRALYDFDLWRGTVKSVTDLGAWRDVARNLIVDGDAHQLLAAEITASAFRVSDAVPLMGRVLTDADARPDAPPVAVLGYGVWRSRFAGDPAILGRNIQLGAEHLTVVGVMREGFAFPISHDLWTPLKAVNDVPSPRSGPAITVFGVLSPGATLETAQTELTLVGQRIAGQQPSTHAHLEPHVLPYAQPGGGISQDEIGIMASIYFFVIALLVLICSNVALLLFARAATRESEITVRTALGAGRSRIVTQMFMEALVLGGVAALVGLGAAAVVLNNWALPFLEMNIGRLPFWYDLSLSPATILFALGLTVFGSGIAGVIPALKVTRNMSSRLRKSTAGAGGLQFGGIWTVVIVVQVAVTVAFPAVVYQEQLQLRHVQTFEAGFAADQYLAARVELDNPGTMGAGTPETREAYAAAFAGRLEEMRRRVSREPGVTGVTFIDRLPRTPGPWRRIELTGDANRPLPSGGDTATEALRVVTVARIDPSYFETLETPIVAGRAFTAADVASSASVAIVDKSFVDQVMQGRNPVGQHVRFDASRVDPTKTIGPWMEIVGVVNDLGMGAPTEVGRAAGLYVPARLDRLAPAYLMVHHRSDPAAFAPALREIATAVDPALRLSNVQPLDQVTDEFEWFVKLWLSVTAVMTGVALVLSLSGIYSVLSFVVARRTREIGVRVALGASQRSVITAIFRRPLIQVTLGVLAGSALLAVAGSVKTEMPGLDGEMSAGQYGLLAAYGVVMLGVCLLACIVPTRRALKVEPTIALRTD